MSDVRPVPGPLRLPLGPRPPSAPHVAARIVASVLVAGAVLAALGPWERGVRAGIVVGLVALAAGVHRLMARRGDDPRPWLALDDLGLRRVEKGVTSPLASFREPFGVTVLARADRKAFVLALTSLRNARFLPVVVGEEDEGGSTPRLRELATTAAESDLPIDAAAALSARDAERLLGAIAARDPAALERVFLVDVQGEPIVLDRTELRVGARRIDLASPLEWRAFVFQELGTLAASMCQATWVRQGDGELFLVAPVPADVAWLASAPDARFVQAPIAEPPPRELRRAIDHVFMAPLRRALERAPRMSRGPSSPAIARPEGRA